MYRKNIKELILKPKTSERNDEKILENNWKHKKTSQKKELLLFVIRYEAISAKFIA